MSTNVQRLSYQRDHIYDCITDRFKELMVEDRHEDALAIADEFYEWLDPNQMDEEETLYYNEEDLLELYSKLICD
jgi:hypothetical protein